MRPVCRLCGKSTNWLCHGIAVRPIYAAVPTTDGGIAVVLAEDVIQMEARMIDPNDEGRTRDLPLPLPTDEELDRRQALIDKNEADDRAISRFFKVVVVLVILFVLHECNR